MGYSTATGIFQQWWNLTVPSAGIKNDQLHRDGDLPAVMNMNGTKYWYKKGVRHRDGGMPAVVNADGTLFFYENGQQQVYS
jgi:hypothetical protein